MASLCSGEGSIPPLPAMASTEAPCVLSVKGSLDGKQNVKLQLDTEILRRPLCAKGSL